jgi:4-hydroxybenzoate polyprenyltransferase
VSSTREALEMIKFSHTVFALPFALLSAFQAARGVPPWPALFWILAAMVAARTAAMSFNRLADRRFDAKNPRTASRALPTGRLSVRFAAGMCAVSSLVFVFSACRLNHVACVLAPPALAVVLLYSFTKRFTSLSHLFLGLCLGLAPVGAWIGVEGTFALPPILLGSAVLFWTAGFDILYSLLDQEFDRKAGLYSLPAALGTRRALWLSADFHGVAVLLFCAYARAARGGVFLWAGIALATAVLVYEHVILRPADLSRVNTAFFTANGLVSIALGLSGILDVTLGVR